MSDPVRIDVKLKGERAAVVKSLRGMADSLELDAPSPPETPRPTTPAQSSAHPAARAGFAGAGAEAPAEREAPASPSSQPPTPAPETPASKGGETVTCPGRPEPHPRGWLCVDPKPASPASAPRETTAPRFSYTDAELERFRDECHATEPYDAAMEARALARPAPPEAPASGTAPAPGEGGPCLGCGTPWTATALDVAWTSKLHDLGVATCPRCQWPALVPLDPLPSSPSTRTDPDPTETR